MNTISTRKMLKLLGEDILLDDHQENVSMTLSEMFGPQIIIMHIYNADHHNGIRITQTTGYMFHMTNYKSEHAFCFTEDEYNRVVHQVADSIPDEKEKNKTLKEYVFFVADYEENYDLIKHVCKELNWIMRKRGALQEKTRYQDFLEEAKEWIENANKRVEKNKAPIKDDTKENPIEEKPRKEDYYDDCDDRGDYDDI